MNNVVEACQSPGHLSTLDNLGRQVEDNHDLLEDNHDCCEAESSNPHSHVHVVGNPCHRSKEDSLDQFDKVGNPEILGNHVQVGLDSRTTTRSVCGLHSMQIYFT
jgi:hypothetical protein